MIVLVAVDFSPVSERQLEIVGRLAKGIWREVYLLHVAEPEPDFIGFQPGPDVVRKQVADEYHREHRRLQEMAETLRQQGVDATALLVQGSIVETILEKAEDLEAGLIIVGSHGHGAAYGLLVGSVSRGVIQRARIPVLVVPAQS